MAVFAFLCLAEKDNPVPRSLLLPLLVLVGIAAGALVPASGLAQSGGPEPLEPGPIEPGTLAVLDRALTDLAEGRSGDARTTADRLADPVARSLVAWFDYRRPTTEATFLQIADFLESHADWPEQGRLRVHGEQKLRDQTVSPARLIRHFERFPALTRFGRTAHIEALMKAGRTDEARDLTRAVWIDTDFPASAEREFREDFGHFIRPEDHIARLDRLAWDAEGRQIERMGRLVPEEHRRLADARLALRRLAPGVDARIARVPERLRDHPGLVYERARWRRLKGRDESARELLWRQGGGTEWPLVGIARDRFWIERHYHVRDALRAGAVSDAYTIARAHGFESGIAFAQGEFLAGWTALRFLADADQALGHFRELHDGVGTPISRARGAYWAGRAAETAGREREAVEWYERAARHGFTFYGQLAAHALDRTPTLTLGPQPTPAQLAGILKRPLGRAATMLALIDRPEEAEDFLRTLGVTLDGAGDRIAAIRHAREIGLPGLSVALARFAAAKGVVSLPDAFPVTGLVDPGQPERALVHAVIRQESLFDPDAISRAGARGMMQILPATAEQEARRQGIAFSRTRLLTDPDYNIRLGRGYLQSLIERYDGSYTLAIAAYNAGPGRVDRWIESFGDPRTAEVDPVDWIEMVPFSETRNYVQRVLEGLTVYRMKLDEPPRAETPETARAVWCLTACAAVADPEAPVR